MAFNWIYLVLIVVVISVLGITEILIGRQKRIMKRQYVKELDEFEASKEKDEREGIESKKEKQKDEGAE